MALRRRFPEPAQCHPAIALDALTAVIKQAQPILSLRQAGFASLLKAPVGAAKITFFIVAVRTGQINGLRSHARRHDFSAEKAN